MIVDAARQRTRERGGNTVLKRGSATRQILDELTELTKAPTTREWKAKWSAAARRVEQSRADHDEAQRASNAPTDLRTARQKRSPALSDTRRRAWPNLLADDRAVDAGIWHGYCTAPAQPEPPPLSVKQWGQLSDGDRRFRPLLLQSQAKPRSVD